MILVLRHASCDQRPEPVLDWLRMYGGVFRQISSADLRQPPANWVADYERHDIRIDGRSLRDEAHVVWYRRNACSGEAGLHEFGLRRKADERYDPGALTRLLVEVLQDKLWLPDYPALMRLPPRPVLLQLAQCQGLITPRLRVLSTRAGLRALVAENGPALLCGSPAEPFSPLPEWAGTGQVAPWAIGPELVEQLPEAFAPLLFEQAVSASCELRVFYLDGGCYATALEQPAGSGSGEQTTIPYQLPGTVEMRIRTFMRAAGLRTGALRLLKDCSGNYVFMDVDPVGRYLPSAQPGHYRVDQRIAQWLIANDHPPRGKYVPPTANPRRPGLMA